MPSDIAGTENYSGGPYQINDPTESGNEVFDLLEEFMQRMATHSHTGQDSAIISLNIEKGVQSLVSGVDFVWDAQGNDIYRATIPVATGGTFDGNVRHYYYLNGTEPVEFHPTIEKIDANTYYLYANDNTVDLKVITL